ncbi:reverse transcriptase domain-containing protein [Tanacetum coccineum]
MADRTNTTTSNIRDEEHSASALMNFVVVRSPSPYNGIIRRLRVRKLQGLVPLECAMVFGPERTLPANETKVEDRIKVAINPEYPEQEIKQYKKRFPFKYFLDTYKGYHQIQMAKEDKEKIAFITNQGIFFYTKMPFGLRNVRATYQYLVDKAFHKQIGRNLEVYVDDLVIKIRTEDEIVRDIEETFQTLREINMKLNPKKCTFRIEEGMFLGYKVSTMGLKVCPDKVDVVLSLPSPKCLKDVKKLNGKLEKRFLLDYGSGRSIQANEATYFRTSHISRTNGKRRAYRLSGGSKRNGKCSPDDETGR